MSKSESRPAIVITPGEPAGIGPDICLKAEQQLPKDLNRIYISDPQVLADRAGLLGIDAAIHPIVSVEEALPNAMNVLAVPCEQPVKIGRVSPVTAPHVLSCLETAFDLCALGRAAGWVTGPVNKAALNDAGLPFTGHTEWIANRANVPRVVMMLVAGTFRVALVTTHLPLRAVADAITFERVEETLRITHQSLRNQFKVSAPRLGICGLNPHAGEGGHLGREEIEILTPVIEKLRAEGVSVSDPLPADTLLTPERIQRFDAIVAMYHDQGLPTLKYAGFGEAVNITLGLPFIRTSVDHGTAADIAGTNLASEHSLLAAIRLARRLCDPVGLATS